MRQIKAHNAGNGKALGKRRNAGLAHWRGSLRAVPQATLSVLRSLEWATAGPVPARLAGRLSVTGLTA